MSADSRLMMLKVARELAQKSADAWSDGAEAHREGEFEEAESWSARSAELAEIAEFLALEVAYGIEHPEVRAILWSPHSPTDDEINHVLDHVEPF